MVEATTQGLSLEDRWKRLELQIPQIPIDATLQDLTLLQVLEQHQEASIFLGLVKQHPNLLQLLQADVDGEHTVFAPVNSGWTTANIDGNTLAAHFSIHYLTTEALIQMPMIPMLLRSSPGNRRPAQKVHCGAFGYSIDGAKILKANVKASNGLIHFIQHPCTLPLDTETVIFHKENAAYFSKGLKLATKNVLFPDQEQSTLVPTDEAFTELGQDTLQFLFESETGRPYLTALLSYHIAVDTTVYTNFIWPQNDTADRLTSSDEIQKLKGNITRPWSSALSDEHGSPVQASLNISRVYGLIDMMVNGSANVVEQNIRSINGSIQMIDRVLLPGISERPVSIEQLREALAAYV